MGWLLGILFFILICVGVGICFIDHVAAKIAGIAGAIISGLLFIFIPFSIRQIDAGQVAVVKKWGEAKEVRGAGMHFDFWISTSYEKYDIKVQQAMIETQAYSSDGQTMDIELVIQYQIQADKAIEIYKNYGELEMLENKIETVSTEKMKSVLSQKSAMVIIETRATVSPDVEEAIMNAITEDYYVNITSVVLTDISFTDTFEKVIEDKMVAEQQKLQAQYEKEKAIIQAEQELEVAKKQAEAQLEKAKKEAESELVLAQAEADALEIVQTAWEAISPEVRQIMLQEMAIENWNGELPDTMVGTDFIEWLMGAINA
jgi:regulator of protease activity HflC (stomatin/prohibitin superfamily)